MDLQVVNIWSESVVNILAEEVMPILQAASSLSFDKITYVVARLFGEDAADQYGDTAAIGVGTLLLGALVFAAVRCVFSSKQVQHKNVEVVVDEAPTCVELHKFKVDAIQGLHDTNKSEEAFKVLIEAIAMKSVEENIFPFANGSTTHPYNYWRQRALQGAYSQLGWNGYGRFGADQDPMYKHGTEANAMVDLQFQQKGLVLLQDMIKDGTAPKFDGFTAQDVIDAAKSSDLYQQLTVK